MLLGRSARRRKLLGAIAAATAGLAVALFAGAIVIVAHRLLVPAWRLEPLLVAVALAVPIAAAALDLLVRTIRGEDRFGEALQLERRFALKERISSALSARSMAIDPAALDALERDAERHAARIPADRVLPFAWPRASWHAAAALALAGALYLFLPVFDFRGAAREREQARAEAERVEARRERLRSELKQVAREAEETPIDVDTKKLLAEIAERERRTAELGDGKAERRAALVELEEMRRRIDERRGRPDLERLEEITAQLAKEAEGDFRTPEAAAAAKALAAGADEAAAAALEGFANKLAAAEKGEISKEAAAALQRDAAELAKKLGVLPGTKELLEKLEGSGGEAALAKLSPEDLASLSKLSQRQLEDLARLFRERDFLAQAREQIELSQEELASLPKEWPELCEACRDGKPCADARGGGG